MFIIFNIRDGAGGDQRHFQSTKHKLHKPIRRKKGERKEIAWRDRVVEEIAIMNHSWPVSSQLATVEHAPELRNVVPFCAVLDCTTNYERKNKIEVQLTWLHITSIFETWTWMIRKCCSKYTKKIDETSTRNDVFNIFFDDELSGTTFFINTSWRGPENEKAQIINLLIHSSKWNGQNR